MGIFNGRVFLLILIFSFIGTLTNYIGMFLPAILYKHVSAYITSIFIVVFYAYFFLLNFVLFFAAFYYLCGKTIQEEPASTIISLILGGFAGTWTGSLAAIPILIRLGMEDFNLIMGLSQMPRNMQSSFTGNVVLAVAAMLSSWFVLKWDEKLAETGFQASTHAPFDIVLVSALFIVSGILSLCILPLMGIELGLPLFIAIIPLALVNAGAEIAIAVGLYRGKRWGWLLAFTASLTGICININSVVAHFQDLWRFALTVIALTLNIMTVMLLLTTSSRKHCRMINPTKTSQQAEA